MQIPSPLFYLLDHRQLGLHHIDTAVLDLATHTIILGSTIVIALDIDLNILALPAT